MLLTLLVSMMLFVPTISTAEPVPKVSEIDGSTWASWSPREQSFFVYGAIFNAYMWSEGLWYAHEVEDFTNSVGMVYELYSLLVPQITDNIIGQINAKYETEPTSTPLYLILHSILQNIRILNPDYQYEGATL